MYSQPDSSSHSMPVMQTAIPCTGSTADQAVSTVHVQLDAAKHLTRPLTHLQRSDAAQRRKPMSHTQHVHSEECDRAESILRLHPTDEPVSPLLRHSGFSVTQVDARDGTVSQAIASGNRLRHSVSPNQIDDVG